MHACTHKYAHTRPNKLSSRTCTHARAHTSTHTRVQTSLPCANPKQGPDPSGTGSLFGLLRSGWDAGCSAADALVFTLSDIFLATPLAPFGADRAAVENSWRTGLALAGLALLQKAIPVRPCAVLCAAGSR